MQPGPASKTRVPRAEQIILFRVGGQLFAISSASVQEVRSVDSLTGMSQEIPSTSVRKVRHTVRRGDSNHFIVNGTVHFGLQAAAASLVFFLRHTPTALLIDGIEKMTTMTYLQALPQAFCHEEREWYRGLTALDQTVVPVVRPEGFLSVEELTLLDTAVQAENKSSDQRAAEKQTSE
ncbi:MAG TPA: chemotaxis protein CheW [Candidatus Dormibacteraeota bacterium]|jgi:chemotaxis signal transduction protein|nr:chemotaxis protein CheW [Candidatus Dormibacteraeota bacterium]